VTHLDGGAQQFEGFAKGAGWFCLDEGPHPAATSSTDAAPMLIAMRFHEPIVFSATGNGLTCPLTVGFSIKRAPTCGRLHLAIG
jgi:hypothetical protein